MEDCHPTSFSSSSMTCCLNLLKASRMLVMHVDIYLVHACEYREVIHNPVPTATNIDDWYLQSQWHTSS